ncbi:MAG: hypothetical protein EOP04_17795 [Proteobacteria bacterium]|nr:MAG: hypothetical protein EOP04_17795 [Pseudomonadota bacterium]
MSLIITTVSSNGVITVTDSNTTIISNGNPHLSQGPPSLKLFRSPSLPLTLSVCGSMDIHGQDAETWIPTFLNSSNAARVEALAEELLRELRCQPVPPKQIIHIAGFEDLSNVYTPIIGHISSVDLAPNGYQPKANGFQLLWNYRAPQYDRAFYQSNGAAIFNGFGDGRDAFATLHQQMVRFRRNVWANPQWKFYAPDLTTEARALQLELEQISLFFNHSGHPTPFIGGAIQVDTHAWPEP